MSGTVGYEELRAATVHQVAQLMAAAAITAPKSGGQLFFAPSRPAYPAPPATMAPETARHPASPSAAPRHEGVAGFSRSAR